MLCVCLVGNYLVFQYHILVARDHAERWSRFEYNLRLEIRLVAVAGLVLLIMQFLRYPRKGTRIRKGSPFIAAALAIAFCWIRWLIYGCAYIWRKPVPTTVDLAIAAIFALTFGWRLAKYRELDT